MPIEITMPRLSDTMENGTIIKWNVSEGDEVSSGDSVADVETDKATMELYVYDDGRVAKILVDEGKAVDVGTVIAVMAAEDEDVADVASKAAEGKVGENGEAKQKDEDESKKEAKADDKGGKKREPESAQTATADADRPEPSGDRDRLRVSPVARRLAEEHDLDLGAIQGSGPQGRIIKRDVLKAIDAAEETAASVPPSTGRDLAPARGDGQAGVPATHVPAWPETGLAPSLQEQRIPLSNMRQTIATRLVESKTTIPHYQVTCTFNMDPLLELRASLNEQLETLGVKLSVNDFLVRACALAMHDHPEFNASWDDGGIQVHGDVNIGVAIAVGRERGGGLVVATIRHADQKSLRVISHESKALSEKARTRGLTIEEMSDSTFVVSNLGMFGVDHFTAIINPPNSAILAVGGAIKKPVVRNDELTIGHEMSATLSCDHRVIDGAMAAQYLQTLRQLIENPATMMV